MASPSGPGDLGSSALLAAGVCPFLFGMRYIAGLVPAPEMNHLYEDRLRGSLVHAGIAYHYAARMPNPPKWFHERTLEEEWLNLAKGQPLLIDQARRTTDFYNEYCRFERWEPLAVEHQFKATVKEIDPEGSGPEDDVIVSAKLDLVPRTSPDTVSIVDHKSTTKKTRDGRLWGWSPQNNFYVYSAATLTYFQVGQIDIPRQLDCPAPEVFIIQRVLSIEPFDVDRNTLDISPVALADNRRAVRVRARAAQQHIDTVKEHGMRALVKMREPLCRTGSSRCDYASICFASNAVDSERALREDFVVVGAPRLTLPRRPGGTV